MFDYGLGNSAMHKNAERDQSWYKKIDQLKYEISKMLFCKIAIDHPHKRTDLPPLASF